jgi:hypothetical protein
MGLYSWGCSVLTYAPVDILPNSCIRARVSAVFAHLALLPDTVVLMSSY